MIRTRVGYAGGTTRHASYRNIGDHAESLQIDFDPAVITYEQLLAEFWASHDSSYPSRSRQYMSAIFYHDERQRAAALASKAAQEKRRGRELHTEVALLDGFTIAEDYHQKYRLQDADALLREYRRIYPDFRDFMNSTAVARVNGYLGGYGNADDLKREIGGLGLSPEAEKILTGIVSSSRRVSRSCPL